MPLALVTGGAKRLGRAMAEYLAGRGFDVAVHYSSSEDAAQDTVAALRAMGVQAQAFHADLLDEAQVQALMPVVSAHFSAPVNCLINNASIFEYDRLETATREGWDRHF